MRVQSQIAQLNCHKYYSLYGGSLRSMYTCVVQEAVMLIPILRMFSPTNIFFDHTAIKETCENVTMRNNENTNHRFQSFQ